jgi:hypothetical protein
VLQSPSTWLTSNHVVFFAAFILTWLRPVIHPSKLRPPGQRIRQVGTIIRSPGAMLPLTFFLVPTHVFIGIKTMGGANFNFKLRLLQTLLSIFINIWISLRLLLILLLYSTYTVLIRLLLITKTLPIELFIFLH